MFVISLVGSMNCSDAPMLQCTGGTSTITAFKAHASAFLNGFPRGVIWIPAGPTRHAIFLPAADGLPSIFRLGHGDRLAHDNLIQAIRALLQLVSAHEGERLDQEKAQSNPDGRALHLRERGFVLCGRPTKKDSSANLL